jgi:hypothetical protein
MDSIVSVVGLEASPLLLTAVRAIEHPFSRTRAAIVFVEVLYGAAMDRGFCRQDTHQSKLLSHRPTPVTEEKWIKANARLIQKMGAESYLTTLLRVLRAGSKRHTSWSNLETTHVCRTCKWPSSGGTLFGSIPWIASRSTRGSSAGLAPIRG